MIPPSEISFKLKYVLQYFLYYIYSPPDNRPIVIQLQDNMNNRETLSLDNTPVVIQL